MSVKSSMHTRLAAITMVVLLIAMVIANWAQAEQLDQTQLQIVSVYQRAFYESGELLSGLQLNLRKFLVSGTGAQEQMLLNAITQQAHGIQDNLSLLPLGRRLSLQL